MATFSVAVVCVAMVAVGLSASRGVADPYVYTQQYTVPVPPASVYAGSSGGDGWDVSLSADSVYNVFHHNGALQVACHKQVDASPCWATDAKVIRDASNNDFSTSNWSGTYLDQTTGKLWVYATRDDGAAGVVCVDTTAPAATPNPFCGFTALGTGSYSSDETVSAPALLGSRLFAYTAGAAPSKLMCFDTSTAAACAGQPFTVDTDGSSSSLQASAATIGDNIYIPISITGGAVVTCFNAAALTDCAGTWPVSVSSGSGTPFPMLTSGGALNGFCVLDEPVQCFTPAGAAAATPAGLDATITENFYAYYGSAAVTVGTRVYVPNNYQNSVECYNFLTSASCVGFPKVFTNLYLLYSVNTDPQRPTCLWVNSDTGVQIQNFDAFGGTGCGEGPIRIRAADIVPPNPVCTPVSYDSLTILDPPRSGYTSGTVAILDADGNPIVGIPPQAIDANGKVNLASFNLAGILPQFLIELVGGSGTPSSVTIELKWTGESDPQCGAVTSSSSSSSSTTTTTTTPPPPGSGPSRDLGDYVLFARSNMDLKGGAPLTKVLGGNVGVNNADPKPGDQNVSLDMCRGGPGRPIVMDKTSQVVADSVSLTDDCDIGNLYTNDDRSTRLANFVPLPAGPGVDAMGRGAWVPPIQNDATLVGWMPNLNDASHQCDAAKPVRVADNQTSAPLAPGAYGSARVDGTLTLGAGRYVFCDMTLNQRAKVVVNNPSPDTNPTIVEVVQQFETKGGTFGDQSTCSTQLIVSGAGLKSNQNSVLFGRQSTVNAQVVALTSSVALGDSTIIHGRVYGGEMHSGAGIEASVCGTAPNIVNPS